MKYKMVASDYDDTRLPRSHVIDEYTLDTINRYVKNGGKFVISTGRMFKSISKIAKEMGLHGDIISYQGALIKNLDSEETLFSQGIDTESAVEYIDFMKRYPLVVQVYADDELYVEEENPYSVGYAKFCGVDLHVIGDFKRFFAGGGTINKIYCSMDSGIAQTVREAAAEKFCKTLLVSSGKPYNVEAVSSKASKGRAIEILAKRYGIGLDEVMAFGDNLNDMEMIETAGFGVAVGNAVDALKERADYVAESCDADGVARTIEKFCLR